MDQVTITDRDAVEAFINAQDDARQQACAAFIASRAALRVAPVAVRFSEFDDHPRKRDLTSLVIWRALLTSEVASSVLTPDVSSAGASASSSANAFANAFAGAASFASASASFAYYAADAAAVWAEVTHDAALWLEYADPRGWDIVHFHRPAVVR